MPPGCKVVLAERLLGRKLAAARPKPGRTSHAGLLLSRTTQASVRPAADLPTAWWRARHSSQRADAPGAGAPAGQAASWLSTLQTSLLTMARRALLRAALCCARAPPCPSARFASPCILRTSCSARRAASLRRSRPWRAVCAALASSGPVPAGTDRSHAARGEVALVADTCTPSALEPSCACGDGSAWNCCCRARSWDSRSCVGPCAQGSQQESPHRDARAHAAHRVSTAPLPGCAGGQPCAGTRATVRGHGRPANCCCVRPPARRAGHALQTHASAASGSHAYDRGVESVCVPALTSAPSLAALQGASAARAGGKHRAQSSSQAAQPPDRLLARQPWRGTAGLGLDQRQRAVGPAGPLGLADELPVAGSQLCGRGQVALAGGLLLGRPGPKTNRQSRRSDSLCGRLHRMGHRTNSARQPGRHRGHHQRRYGLGEEKRRNVRGREDGHHPLHQEII